MQNDAIRPVVFVDGQEVNKTELENIDSDTIELGFLFQRKKIYSTTIFLIMTCPLVSTRNAYMPGPNPKSEDIFKEQSPFSAWTMILRPSREKTSTRVSSLIPEK